MPMSAVGTELAPTLFTSCDDLPPRGGRCACGPAKPVPRPWLAWNVFKNTPCVNRSYSDVRLHPDRIAGGGGHHGNRDGRGRAVAARLVGDSAGARCAAAGCFAGVGAGAVAYDWQSGSLATHGNRVFIRGAFRYCLSFQLAELRRSDCRHRLCGAGAGAGDRATTDPPRVELGSDTQPDAGDRRNSAFFGAD